MSLRDIVFHNFWPKIISLVLAVATWFYVFDVINTDSFSQKQKTVEDILSQYQFTVKEVPVKPVFAGKSPSGYRVDFEKVKIEPSSIAVFGPQDIIDGVEELRTDKITLGEYTRSARLQLGVHSDVKFLQIKDKAVDVYIPVVAAEKPVSKEPAK